METANPAQAEAWNGEEGKDWVVNADRYERSGVRHRPHLYAAAALAEGDRVLDVGCGTGRSTIEAGRRVGGSGHVLGVDLSGPMLAYARARAADEGVTNVAFLQADAQVHRFERASVDVVLSETGCMFFGDPVAAYRNLATAVRPGGRLALLVWRELDRNEWIMAIRGAVALGRELPAPAPDAPGHPFSMADPERVRPMLAAAGFGDIAFEPLDEPMLAGTDAADAFEFLGKGNFVGWLLEGVDEAGRAEALANLRDVFEAAETPEGVLLGTSAWLISARR